MKIEHIVRALEQAAGQLGLEVRSEKGNFRGGRCVVNGHHIIMLNKRHTPEVQLAVLAESLRDQPVDTLFLRPAVREALEESWQQRAADRIEAEEADADS